MPLSSELFDYDLPAQLIAQTPASRRDASRLLVVDRQRGNWSHHHFRDLPAFLQRGDTLFRNNAAVLPARLHAQRPSGGAVECFLVRPEPARGENTWWCLLRPGKKLPVGASFRHATDFSAEVLAKDAEGGALVRFDLAPGDSVTALANRLGRIPLPPYIVRDDDSGRTTDGERYQTVYADRERQVAVAAPTAGLHFTPELLGTLSAGGVQTADITLHVGLGTFRPISTPTIEAHAIHREIYQMPAATQQALFAPSGRRVAVGTTSVRTVEDFLRRHQAPLKDAFHGEADVYLYPPSSFRGVDALITNFHQPRSTLLCLVSAFLRPGSIDGIAWLKEIYADAIAQEYRFFSYGDAMLIL